MMEVGPWTSQKCVKESCKVRSVQGNSSEEARLTIKSISTELRTSRIKPPFYAIVAMHALHQGGGMMMMQVSRGESGQRVGREQERAGESRREK